MFYLQKIKTHCHGFSLLGYCFFFFCFFFVVVVVVVVNAPRLMLQYFTVDNML